MSALPVGLTRPVKLHTREHPGTSDCLCFYIKPPENEALAWFQRNDCSEITRPGRVAYWDLSRPRGLLGSEWGLQPKSKLGSQQRMRSSEHTPALLLPGRPVKAMVLSAMPFSSDNAGVAAPRLDVRHMKFIKAARRSSRPLCCLAFTLWSCLAIWALPLGRSAPGLAE